MAVVLTLVETKPLRINIHKLNITKENSTNKNTVNTSVHITKIPTHYKIHTYTHPHITKQVKQPQYKLKQTQYKKFAN